MMDLLCSVHCAECDCILGRDTSVLRCENCYLWQHMLCCKDVPENFYEMFYISTVRGERPVVWLCRNCQSQTEQDFIPEPDNVTPVTTPKRPSGMNLSLTLPPNPPPSLGSDYSGYDSESSSFDDTDFMYDVHRSLREGPTQNRDPTVMLNSLELFGNDTVSLIIDYQPILSDTDPDPVLYTLYVNSAGEKRVVDNKGNVFKPSQKEEDQTTMYQCVRHDCRFKVRVCEIILEFLCAGSLGAENHSHDRTTSTHTDCLDDSSNHDDALSLSITGDEDDDADDETSLIIPEIASTPFNTPARHKQSNIEFGSTTADDTSELPHVPSPSDKLRSPLVHPVSRVPLHISFSDISDDSDDDLCIGGICSRLDELADIPGDDIPTLPAPAKPPTASTMFLPVFERTPIASTVFLSVPARLPTIYNVFSPVPARPQTAYTGFSPVPSIPLTASELPTTATTIHLPVSEMSSHAELLTASRRSSTALTESSTVSTIPSSASTTPSPTSTVSSSPSTDSVPSLESIVSPPASFRSSLEPPTFSPESTASLPESTVSLPESTVSLPESNVSLSQSTVSSNSLESSVTSSIRTESRDVTSVANLPTTPSVSNTLGSIISGDQGEVTFYEIESCQPRQKKAGSILLTSDGFIFQNKITDVENNKTFWHCTETLNNGRACEATLMFNNVCAFNIGPVSDRTWLLNHVGGTYTECHNHPSNHQDVAMAKIRMLIKRRVFQDGAIDESPSSIIDDVYQGLDHNKQPFVDSNGNSVLTQADKDYLPACKTQLLVLKRFASTQKNAYKLETQNQRCNV